MSSIYNGEFSGNVLVVGKTGCRKTYFPQKLGLNKFYGKLVITEWVSSMNTDEERKAETPSCFTNKVEFHSAKELDEFIDLIEKCKLRTRDIVNEEKKKAVLEKKLLWIVLLLWTTSQICKKFAEFLTVCRKYRYHCYLCLPYNCTREQNFEKDFIAN